MVSRNKKALVHGFGVNDADYQIKTLMPSGSIFRCPFYRAWANMLKRCYDKSSLSANPSYIGCSVSEEWLIFSEFKKWMTSQDWEGKHLDKDILFKGNKVYSSNTCVFISPALNNFLNSRALHRGKWPIGVYFCSKRNKFKAQCSNPFTLKIEALGYFTNPERAHQAWRMKKHSHALRYSDMQDDLRISNALKNRYIGDWP